MAVDDTQARSMFGTKDYWDDVYLGRGDVPADCYSWYYGWEVLRPIVERYVPIRSSITTQQQPQIQVQQQQGYRRMLIPGIGNDSLLMDLYKAGYRPENGWYLVGQDYSEHAIERQYELLSFEQFIDGIHMVQGDVTAMPQNWTKSFDIILEKGLLDAVYLSSGADNENNTNNVQSAISNLHRVLKPNGLLFSISGVIPQELRRSILFPSIYNNNPLTNNKDDSSNHRSNGNDSNDDNDNKRDQIPQKEFSSPCSSLWKWLQDGSDDWRKAGCFVFQKQR